MKFGAHESIEGGVFNAIYRGQKATCDTIQMFNKSNNQWRAKALSPEEVAKYFAAIEETGITVACSHSSYLINLGSPDPALNEKSYNGFKEEIERCNLLKIPNLVIHPGSHVGSGEEAGMKAIIANLNKALGALKQNTVTVCLETTAGQGSNLGCTFEQIGFMLKGVEDQEHIGVCMDTCHIFAAGYPIVDPADYKTTMKKFDDLVGLDKLRVLHINDSKKGLGSKVDRHEHIGKGEIGLEGFRNIVNDKRLAKIPMVLETPKEEELLEDIENLKVLRGLIKK
jgi:deoxyribonuclease IV